MIDLCRRGLRQTLSKIESDERELSRLDDDSLRRRSIELMTRARGKAPLAELIPDGFALVREAASRHLGMRHYPNQVAAGYHLCRERMVEMETGQGKTLTATLPLYVHALAGKGAHLATSNDYLATRDSATMAPLFQALGLTCGHLENGMSDGDRRESYQCDITYGAGTEFGFDFLRDRVKKHENANAANVVQRCQHFVLADEADAVLIDDANTPLILGTESPVDEDLAPIYSWALAIASLAKERQHYRYDPDTASIELTPLGRSWIRSRLAGHSELFGESAIAMYDVVRKALRVQRDFRRDQHYLVREGEIVLINQSTGRLGEGREMQDGLHQLIQCRENLPITKPNSHTAHVTVQGLFLMYRHLAGMSGTLLSAKKEFSKIYRAQVVRVENHQPSRRVQWPTQAFATDAEKNRAVIQEVQSVLNDARAVLVGTASVHSSETLSQAMTESKIDHRVLNARSDAEEAEIVGAAGQVKAVTIATGMAGRGTDIKLADAVRRAGGLHVILTELHDSVRSDYQLFGRCARQGDPGTYRQFLSLEDSILERCHGRSAASLAKRCHRRRSRERCLLSARSTLERKNRNDRLRRFEHEKRILKSLLDVGLDPVLERLC